MLLGSSLLVEITGDRSHTNNMLLYVGDHNHSHTKCLVGVQVIAIPYIPAYCSSVSAYRCGIVILCTTMKGCCSEISLTRVRMCSCKSRQFLSVPSVLRQCSDDPRVGRCKPQSRFLYPKTREAVFGGEAVLPILIVG